MSDSAKRLLALDAAMRDAPWRYLEGSGSADPEEGDELQDGNGEMVASNFSDTVLPRIMDGRGCAALRNALPELAAFLAAAEALRVDPTWQTRPAFDAALVALNAKLAP